MPGASWLPTKPAEVAPTHRPRRTAKPPPRGHDNLPSTRRDGIYESAGDQGRRNHRAQPTHRELLRTEAGRAGRNSPARHPYRMVGIACPARWALSPHDSCVQMMASPSKHPQGILTARCGHLLPTTTHTYDQPPRGTPCERCRVMFLGDFLDASPTTYAQFP